MIEAVSNMSTQIATATEEQKATSSEILKAVSRVNESIQEIAASSQQMGKLVELIGDKSAHMKQTIRMFNL